MAIDNKQIASDVLAAVGGKDNVSMVTHCATRLRFNLKDASIPKEEEIKKIHGVIGTVSAGGQLQIIVGQNVSTVYDEVCRLGGFEAQAAIDENLDGPKEKLTPKRIGANILNYLTGSMTPLIYPLLGAAMWNSIGLLLGPSVLNVISADSGFYVTTQLIYNALFYFLPVYVGYSAAKTLKISNPVWGIIIGGMILVPSFTAMVGTAETFLLFSFLPVPVANYGQTLLPVLLGVWLFSYLDKLLRKIIPTIVYGVVAPIIIFGVMMILMYAVCAPLGNFFGEGISAIFLFMGNSVLPLKIVAYMLLAAIWPIITLCGMHMPICLAALGIVATGTPDPFVLICSSLSIFFIYGMALGACIKYKKNANKVTAISAFITGFIGAVCEPILYGICLKTKSAIAVMLGGGAFMGLLAALLGPTYNNVGMGNVLSLFGIFAGSTPRNLVVGIGLTLFAVVLGAIATVLFVKLDEE